jgi:hypothetical protein
VAASLKSASSKSMVSLDKWTVELFDERSAVAIDIIYIVYIHFFHQLLPTVVPAIVDLPIRVISIFRDRPSNPK